MKLSKTYIVPLVGTLIFAIPAGAQEAPTVIGHVSAPQAEKQPLPATTVLTTAVHQQPDHTVFVQKIEAPDLPELPAPSTEPATTSRSINTLRQPRKTLGLSATIYNHQKSLLQWTYEGEKFAAWSNVDFNILTTIGNVSAGDDIYTVLMFPLNVDTAALTQFAQAHGKTYQPPVIPDFPSESPTITVIQGDAGNSVALAPVNALIQKYAADSSNLKAIHAQRLADAAAQAAYNKAHPKQAKDTTVQFWRRDPVVPNEQPNQQEGGQ